MGSPVIILTPETLGRLRLSAPETDAGDATDLWLKDEEIAVESSSLAPPAALRGRTVALPCGFQTAGDAVLLLGVASPGLHPAVEATAFQRVLLELAERDFLRSAAATGVSNLASDVRAALPAGLDLRWNRGAAAEARESLAAGAPLALISCRSRAHLALAGCVERTKAVAVVMLGHVSCSDDSLS